MEESQREASGAWELRYTDVSILVLMEESQREYFVAVCLDARNCGFNPCSDGRVPTGLDSHGRKRS